jgi:hypothetical protein
MNARKLWVELFLAGCANVTSAKRLSGNTWQIESHHGSDTATAEGLVTRAQQTCPDGYRVVQQFFDGSSMIIQCNRPRRRAPQQAPAPTPCNSNEECPDGTDCSPDQVCLPRHRQPPADPASTGSDQ